MSVNWPNRVISEIFSITNTHHKCNHIFSINFGLLLPSDMDVDAISKYELEAVDRASADLVLIRVLLCKLMVWDVSDGGVKAGEVSTHFRVRYRARPIQGNLKTDEVVVNVGRSKGRHKKKLFFFFRKTPKGGRGDLAQSEISLSEKTKIFLNFFKRGGSHL